MDLLTYAVNRKLTHVEDPLLEYVSQGRDVPVSVIESSFEGLLKPLEDERSSLLVEDYPRMLERYVPVQFTSNNLDGGYEVSGEISEELLEAIKLVHGKGQEEVISELISESTSKITSRPVSVGSLSLEELTSQMENLTNNLSDVDPFERHDLAYEDIEEVSNEHEVELDDDFAECLAEEVIEDLTYDVAAEDIDEFTEEEFTEDLSYDVEESYDVEDEDYVEEFTEEEFTEEEYIEDDLAEELADDFAEDYSGDYAEYYEDDVAVESEEEYVEEMTEEELAAEESNMLAEGIRKVYSRLVEDLKAYGLDESLGLSL